VDAPDGEIGWQQKKAASEGETGSAIRHYPKSICGGRGGQKGSMLVRPLARSGEGKIEEVMRHITSAGRKESICFGVEGKKGSRRFYSFHSRS